MGSGLPSRSMVLALGMALGAPVWVPAPAVGQEPEAYDPNYDPRTDPNSPEYDPGYWAAEDPNHPLRQEEDPGEAWDAVGGSDARADGSPSVRRATGDWDWGELFYDMTIPARLVVRNQCEGPEVVTITVNNLPYLTMPKRVTVPGMSEIEVEGTIQTPEAPGPIILTGAETLPEEGIFIDVGKRGGSVVLWHPWNPGVCEPKREIYTVAGHIHFPPESGGGGGGGPEEIASPDACTVQWNTGAPAPDLEGRRHGELGRSGTPDPEPSESPVSISRADPSASPAKPSGGGDEPHRQMLRGPDAGGEEDEECGEETRVMALHHLERIVQGPAADDPDAWEWLPTREEIREMSVAELLEFKARADAQLGDGGNA